MDIIRKKKAAYFFLLLTSLLTFVIWRYEVEYYGWAGLLWLGYFHKAIPICFFLFVAWFIIYVEAPSRRLKRLYVLCLLGIGSSILTATFFILCIIFGFGGNVPIWMLCFFLYPLLLFPILRRFNLYIPVPYILLAQFLFSGAPLICVELIRYFPWQATADSIHVFKTGYIYPFWFFAIGFPVIHCQLRNTIKEQYTMDILDAR